MPRTARKISSTGIYHIVIRGADRQLMFEEHADYIKYLNYLEYYKNECDFDIYAYCLMSNHVHILMRINSTALSKIFQRIGTSYASWFNMKYNRTGYLQQGRYYSEPVESQEYLLTVARYIHQNPFNAGLEAFPGESYNWSSLSAYAASSDEFVNASFLLNLYGDYNAFMKHQTNVNHNDKCLDLNAIRRRIPDDVAKKIIYETCMCSNSKEFQSLSVLDRNKMISTLHKKGISTRQLNRLTGIPLGVINRIIAKDKSSQ